MLPTIIIDNFFPNPDDVRSYALSLQDWYPDEKLAWPGIRTKKLHLFAKEYHDSIAWSIYNCFSTHITTKYNAFVKFDCMFHLVEEKYLGGWIHDDGNDLDFAGLVYLNPNPSVDSGTSLYHHMTDTLEYFDDETHALKKKFFSDPTSQSDYLDLNQKRAKQFSEVTKIENVYNRCVIYDSRTWHSANKYFGNTRENSRLTLVFFGKLGNGQDNIK